MWIRKRGPFSHLVFGDAGLRARVLEWKKAGNRGETLERPNIDAFCHFLEEYGGRRVDLVTVPPPSFHDYGRYPAETLARVVCESLGIPLSIFWPDRYEKKGKVWHANISKIYPEPAEECAGQVVLILDDIATTGNTLTAACDSVVRAGGFPVGVAIG